jgi:hypothetical protein
MDTIEKASKLKDLIESPTWKEILLPEIDAEINFQLQYLRKEKDMRELFFTQGRIAALENLISRLNFMVVDGEVEYRKMMKAKS